MTGYSSSDLAGGWEFKILRSATGQFGKPEQLRRALEEEGRAGWVLVEKFDDKRLRLKRPASTRAGDPVMGAGAGGGVDPYRTTFGMSENRLGLTIAGIVIGTIALAGLIAFIATR